MMEIELEDDCSIDDYWGQKQKKEEEGTRTICWVAVKPIDPLDTVV